MQLEAYQRMQTTAANKAGVLLIHFLQQSLIEMGAASQLILQVLPGNGRSTGKTAHSQVACYPCG